MQCEDELEIRNVAARFTDAVNRAASADLAALFADDSTWEVPGLPPVHGQAAVAAQLDSLLANFAGLVQLTHSGHVDVAGDVASAVWYLTEHAVDAAGTEYTFTGVYRDELVRTAHGWRFRTRRFDFLRRAKSPARAKWYAHPLGTSRPAAG